MIEFTKATRAEITNLTSLVEADMRAVGLGYHFPVLFGADTKKYGPYEKRG